METDGDNGLWAAVLPAALVLVCCAGPVLVAAASAGAFVTMAAWLEGYRSYLVATAVVLAWPASPSTRGVTR